MKKPSENNKRGGRSSSRNSDSERGRGSTQRSGTRTFRKSNDSDGSGEDKPYKRARSSGNRPDTGKRSFSRRDNDDEGSRPYKGRPDRERTSSKRTGADRRRNTSEGNSEESRGSGGNLYHKKRSFSKNKEARERGEGRSDKSFSKESGNNRREGGFPKRSFSKGGRREEDGRSAKERSIDNEKRYFEERGSEGRGSYGKNRLPSDDPRNRGFSEDRSDKKSFSKDGEDKGFSKKKDYKDKNAGKKSVKIGRKSDDEGGLIRLNKYIANTGLCSRREADEMILAGVVSVNGEVVTELGYKIQPEDEVRYNNQLLKREKHVYLLLNKPKDFITTTDDPQERKTVMSLIEGACRERVYPVGRLDRATTGLLMFTNDGEMTKKLTHPSSRVRKIYHVELDKSLKVADMKKIIEGVELEDGVTMVDDIKFVGEGKNKKEIGLTLHSGKNRIVRRIFESLGYTVKKLDRVVFAGLTKKDLGRGRWRFLTPMEINMLKML